MAHKSLYTIALLLVGLLWALGWSHAEPAQISPDVEAVAPIEASKKKPGDSEKQFTPKTDVVITEQSVTPNAPQETAPSASQNKRVREITGQFDLLWPSAKPGFQVKPSGAASAEGILRKMGQSEDAETRRRAVEGMRVIGNGLEGAELLQALQDPSAAVREAAASSLVGAPPELAFAAVMGVLTIGTADEVASIQGVLPRLKASIEKPMLDVLLQDDESIDRRTAAAYSLGRVRCVDALRLLVDLAWSGEPPLSVVSAESLAYMGDPSTALDLVDLLKHANADVRYAAVAGLGRIGGPDAVLSLSDLVTTPDENRTYVRELAVAVLGRIAGRGAVPVLIQAMTAPNMAVREAAGGELRRLTGMKLGNEPAVWEAWYAEQEAMRQQALPPEQSEVTPPLVPSLPLEVPPGVTLDGEQEDK